MALPLIILCGQAGSGKDTVASFIVADHDATAIALADPMKRLAKQVFGFTEEQLWGPSEMRNAVDPRLGVTAELYAAWDRLDAMALKYVQDLLGPGIDANEARVELIEWFQRLWRRGRQDGGLNPRLALQTLGTEWGRCVSKNIWVDYAKRTAMELLGGGYRYERDIGLTTSPGTAPGYVVITDGRFRNEIVSVLAMGGTAWRIVSPDADGAAVEKAGVPGHASEVEQRSIPDHFFDLSFYNDKSRGLEHCRRQVNARMSRKISGYDLA